MGFSNKFEGFATLWRTP